ncbi:MAG: transposase [Phycisphaerae bacterium]
MLRPGAAGRAKLIPRLRRQRTRRSTFLQHVEVDATNNRAERNLRPDVIARELTRGYKTPRGVRTRETLASPSGARERRLRDFAELLRPLPRVRPTPDAR